MQRAATSGILNDAKTARELATAWGIQGTKMQEFSGSGAAGGRVD